MIKGGVGYICFVTYMCGWRNGHAISLVFNLDTYVNQNFQTARRNTLKDGEYILIPENTTKYNVTRKEKNEQTHPRYEHMS